MTGELTNTGSESDKWSNQAYNYASKVLLSTNIKATETIQFQGGTLVSMRGLAGYLMAAGFPGAINARSDAALPKGELRSSITSFQQTAIKLGKRSNAAGNRTISAALNYLLALEQSTQLSVEDDSELPLRLRDELLELLGPKSHPTTPRGSYIERLLVGVQRHYPYMPKH